MIYIGFAYKHLPPFSSSASATTYVRAPSAPVCFDIHLIPFVNTPPPRISLHTYRAAVVLLASSHLQSHPDRKQSCVALSPSLSTPSILSSPFSHCTIVCTHTTLHTPYTQRLLIPPNTTHHTHTPLQAPGTLTSIMSTPPKSRAAPAEPEAAAAAAASCAFRSSACRLALVLKGTLLPGRG